jgi:hypothetical protein
VNQSPRPCLSPLSPSTVGLLYGEGGVALYSRGTVLCRFGLPCVCPFLCRLQRWLPRGWIPRRLKLRVLSIPALCCHIRNIGGAPLHFSRGFPLSDVLRCGLYGHLIDALGRDVPPQLSRRRVADKPLCTHQWASAHHGEFFFIFLFLTWCVATMF